jgi:hypothetical protein
MKQYYKYIIIILIVLISLLGYLIYLFNNEFIDNFSLNLLTEIIGIFITIIVIDKLLDYGKEKEKKRIKEIVNSKLGAKIKDIARLYVEIYKASVDSTNLKKFESYEQFFDDYNFNHIFNQYLYFNISRKAPSLPSRTWQEHIVEGIEKNLNDIKEVIDIYLIYLDTPLIDYLEQLRDDFQLTMFKNQPQINKILRDELDQEWRTGLVCFEESLTRKSFNLFDELFKRLKENGLGDNFGLIDKGIWSDIVAPKIGSARFSENEMWGKIEKLHTLIK